MRVVLDLTVVCALLKNDRLMLNIRVAGAEDGLHTFFCLHLLHSKVSVSVCVFAAPLALKRFSSIISWSCAFLSADAMSCEVYQHSAWCLAGGQRTAGFIDARLDGCRSPAITAERKLGLFLSLRLVKRLRILVLYPAVASLPLFLNTTASISLDLS